MRPVSKGNNDKKFSQYQDARGELIDTIGQYCSYCEMKADASLAVEHVQPKKHHPELSCQWDNFLLSCGNCNSHKGDEDIDIKAYLWPHKDNTFRAFNYSEGGVVSVNPRLSAGQKECAQNTLDLVGLQKQPNNDSKRKDRRWINRKGAWETARIALNNLKKNDSKELRNTIIVLAKEYWSIWMTVFENEPDMLRRFIETFPGTCRECFDKGGKPKERKGGMV